LLVSSVVGVPVAGAVVPVAGAVGVPVAGAVLAVEGAVGVPVAGGVGVSVDDAVGVPVAGGVGVPVTGGVGVPVAGAPILVDVSPKLLVVPVAGPDKSTLLPPEVEEPPLIPGAIASDPPDVEVVDDEGPPKLVKSELVPVLLVVSEPAGVVLAVPVPVDSVVPVALPPKFKFVDSLVFEVPELSPETEAVFPRVFDEISPLPVLVSAAVAPVVPNLEAVLSGPNSVAVSLVVAPVAVVLPLMLLSMLPVVSAAPDLPGPSRFEDDPSVLLALAVPGPLVSVLTVP